MAQLEASSGESSSTGTSNVRQENQGDITHTTRSVEISINQSTDGNGDTDCSIPRLDPVHATTGVSISTRQISSPTDTNKLDPLPSNSNRTADSNCSSTTSSYHSLGDESCDLDDDLNGSEGSFSLDDLVGCQDANGTNTADHGDSSCESSIQSEKNCGSDEPVGDSCNDASQSDNQTRPSTTFTRSRRRRDEGWEDLSSRTLYGEEESSFDMSSRSVLEDFDFEIDCADINEERSQQPPRVKFSAGRTANRNNDPLGVRAARAVNTLAASPMTRITEHTRESSAWGSQSDLSGRCSFESASPSTRFGSIRTRTEDVLKASPSQHNDRNSSLRAKRNLVDIDDLVQRLTDSKLE